VSFPSDYYERVYAGVLGKIIGVYLGRPIEGWSYDRIMADLGEIEYYVNDRLDLPLRNHELVVTDDDISGTFTFLRALPDYDYSAEITPAQIGQTWLNYIIENKTILWWGGMGNSTEHTAFLRLKDGISAPRSGSIALNGKIVAEQIGAQIFIDGWGLIAPGDPEMACALAGRAASVSHDGEAIYGAQVIAALIAQSFVEPDINKLLDTSTSLIPDDSLLYRLICDIREWHAGEGEGWHAARAKLEEKYGYDRYGGNCHIIPNHGLIIISLLYGRGDFSRSQTIINTCGWDTDCNAGNIGCILGVRNGLAAFDGKLDWRGPVADRLYIPTADGGRSITDALRETDHILDIAYQLNGDSYSKPKDGARFHFSLPGSVQGFLADDGCQVENLPHPGELDSRVLAVRYKLEPGRRTSVLTHTFIPRKAIEMPGYSLLASPTIYPGQVIKAGVGANHNNSFPIHVNLAIQYYGTNDKMETIVGPRNQINPGEEMELTWLVPELNGNPIAKVGISLSSDHYADGSVYLDRLTWDCTPIVDFHRPAEPGSMWFRQWIDALSGFEDRFDEPFRLIQNRGRGIAITGTRDWQDFQVAAEITPHMAKAFGLAARVQGLERYYALLLKDGNRIQLTKRLDGEMVIWEDDFTWTLGRRYKLKLSVHGKKIEGWVDGESLFSVTDSNRPLLDGGLGLIVEEGRVGVDRVSTGALAANLLGAQQ